MSSLQPQLQRDARNRARSRAARKQQMASSQQPSPSHQQQSMIPAGPPQQQGMAPQQQQQLPGQMPPQQVSPAYAGRPPSLSRQASIYSLTLDEFQNAISEPGQKQNFGSMNMDEFLKNIWTAEESQAMAAALAAGADQQQVGHVRQASLQRQSSLTLPRTLSRKTVDEVWNDIHLGAQGGAAGDAGGPSGRQMTFGEMTLEDFLLKAGVVREEPNGLASAGSFGLSQYQIPYGPPPGSYGGQTPAAVAAQQQAPPMSAQQAQAQGPLGTQAQATLEAIQNAANQQQAEWMSYQLNNANAAAALVQQQQAQQQQLLQAQAAEAAAAFVTAHKRAAVAGMPPGSSQPAPLSLAVIDRPAMDVVALPSPVGVGQGNGLALASPLNQDGRGKKRVAEVVEKVVERRQRRMIKNRESAARSRARKQAYTVELEAEVMQLKDENNRLRKELLQVKDGDDPEENRRRKLSLLDTLAPANQRPQQHKDTGNTRNISLRRTRSGLW